MSADQKPHSDCSDRANQSQVDPEIGKGKT
jgi:hypothetical protein